MLLVLFVLTDLTTYHQVCVSWKMWSIIKMSKKGYTDGENVTYNYTFQYIKMTTLACTM